VVTVTSGNGALIREFHKVMLEAGRPIIAEFSWGGGRYIPVSVSETFPNVIRLDVRRDSTVLAFCTSEAIKTLGGGMGEFNRNFTWRDISDTPEKYEVTICGGSGRSPADVAIRQFQKFRVAAGKSYHWAAKNLNPQADAGSRKPDTPPPPSEGDVTADNDGLLRINGMALPGAIRLVVTVKQG
jgi:hypothetical protein